MLKKVAGLDILSSKPIDFGICEESNQILMLLSWIEGEDLKLLIPQFTFEKQYELGLEGGKILKQIHSQYDANFG